ncbi:MAG: hypothetical protein K2K82_05890 [Muribaculaceae bacterium]|nr:hypothetical protein [Muribaculaceae bacterium]
MFKSLIKLLMSPHRASFKPSERTNPLIILGNGPSLNQTLAESAEALAATPLMAVNFFANTPLFHELKPEFYVLADPHFFRNASDPNVRKLMENIETADWPMTLFVPFEAKPMIANKNIRIQRFPLKAMEGPGRFRRLMFSLRLGMPRPRNVLIPSIMIGIWLGFKEIYICGADHTWIKTLSVNDRNEVISVQPHFYKEDDRELERQRVDYLSIPLHQILESQSIAFRAYHTIQDYASRRDINIYNATPGSFIDAFTRKQLWTRK